MKFLFEDFNIPYLLKDSNYPVGGACIRLYAFAKGLVELGHQVGILTWGGANKYVEKDVDFDLVETYPLNGGIRKLRWFYKRFPLLISAIKEYKPDFLIQKCRSVNTGIMAFISKMLSVPFIYMATNDIDADSRYKINLNKIEQVAYVFGLKKTDGIICQNKYQLKRFELKYPRKKITMIRNPYAFENGLPVIKTLEERRYVAWVGIFQYQKNLPALLEIVKCLPKIEFKIAGKIVNNRNMETKMALVTLRECKNVTFVGYLKRKEILLFLSSAYALLNTSRYEGFSNTFLEAFAAGTPVVAISKVDPDDIISTNKLGKVVKDYSEIPNAVISLINDKNRNTISRRCREYLTENHNPKLLGEKFINFLLSL